MEAPSVANTRKGDVSASYLQQGTGVQLGEIGFTVTHTQTPIAANIGAQMSSCYLTFFVGWDLVGNVLEE